MNHTLLRGGAVLALTGLTAFAAASVANHSGAAKPSLEKIKSLAGEWLALDEEGERTDTVVSRSWVTAGGSALLEILFPGTDHEMVSVYHQDGDALMLTHYCAMGNQPRMRARTDGGEDEIVFECIGGTNMRSEDDTHVHGGRLQWLEDGRVLSEWNVFSKGKKIGEHRFELVRKEE